MSLRLGDIAPNFTAKSSLGDLNFEDSFKTFLTNFINYYKFKC